MQDDRFFKKHFVGDHLASLFDDIPGFTYFVKDRELKYVAYNNRLQEIFKVQNIEDILGKRDEDFFPASLINVIREDDIKILTTGESIINRVELVPRSTGVGLVDWTTTTKKPLYNQEGEICGIVGVTRPFDRGNTALDVNEDLGEAIAHIQEHFHEPLAVSELAKLVNLSPSTFLRRFKSCFDMTPKEYIRTLKVQDACHKLVQTTMTLAEVSYACGFSDQSHFSREFSRIMKETPSSYRRRFRLGR